ncbi:hypothetical protein ACSNOK_28105 [Streptomyces sp. URMC 126]
MMGIAQAGHTVLTVFLVLYALLGSGIAYLTICDIRSVDRLGITAARLRARSPSRRSNAAAKVLKALAGVGMVLALPVAFGVVLPHLIRSFGRYTVGERYERRRIGLES